MNDPYKVLGINSNATDDEVRDAYRKMSLKYHPDMHSQSPLADVAEEKMKEINAAFDSIMDMRRGGNTQTNSNYNSSGYSSDFQGIRSQIQSGNVTVADEMLDKCSEKNAEWNFLKGTVCYQRGWLNEAYNFYQRAVQMEPSNAEYNAVFNRMNSYRQGNMNGNPNPYRQNNIGGCSGCDMCSSLLCADCCCECFGGDIIPCC